MKTCFRFFILYGLLTVGACKSQKVVDAKIFERKEQGSNRLLIKYNYMVEGKQYVDSAEIDNIVLHGDYISVRYDKSSPDKATPLVAK